MKIRPELFENCLKEIAARGRMGSGEALDILQEVAYRGDRMRQTGEADPFVYAAADMADKLRESARLDRLDALRNAKIRNSILTDVAEGGGIRGAVTTIRSILHGTSKGGRDSVQAMWRGLAANWQGVLGNKLRQGGVERVAVKGALDKEVAEALWRAHGGQPNTGVTISRPAQLIADAIKPPQDNARARLNAAGARIGDAMDYAAHTEHDASKMRAAAGPRQSADAAFAAWWQAERPRWAESTFADLVPREGETTSDARTRFGRSVYDALVSGIHMTADGALGLATDDHGYVPPAFEGTGNLARRLSQPRVIHYRDSQAWLEHMQQFGTSPTLTAGVMRTLDASARHTALMTKLGTNPAANLNQVVRSVQETYRSDLDGIARFQRRIAGINNVMGRLDGSLNVPVHEMAAKIGASIRTWESMSSLGGVGVTHFASIWPTVTSEMAHHGVPRLQTLGNMVAALVRGKGSAERQAVLADLGAYAAGLSRDMHARWQPEESIPGRLSAVANTFMKYTGIHYIFDNTQAAVREMLAHQLGRSTATGFDTLDPHLTQMLGKYGVRSAEWDLLRNVDKLPVADGRAYMTPDVALRTDPAAVEALLRSRGEIGDRATADVVGKKVAAYQRTIADRLLSYYSDAADHSVVTAGVREKALLLGATRPGSAAGELMRFVSQFRAWPVAALTQIIGREIYMSASKAEAAANIFTLAAISAAFGYLRMSVNDVATGRPVRSPMDPATMLAGLAQGGGLGIMGDFLFGQVNRMGGGLLDVAAGPAIGDLNQFVQIYNKFRTDLTGKTAHQNGTFADIWPELARFATSKLPFANLVYLKGSLDYLLFYHLWNAASPGWWERSSRRLEQEQGRGMAGYVPGGGVPFGIPGLYLRNQAGQTFGLLGENK